MTVARYGDPRLHSLGEASTTWLIVAIAGFWLGFGFITGPLVWVKAKAVREGYRALGVEPSGSSTAAYVIGLISSLLYAMLVLGFIAFYVLAVL